MKKYEMKDYHIARRMMFLNAIRNQVVTIASEAVSQKSRARLQIPEIEPSTKLVSVSAPNEWSRELILKRLKAFYKDSQKCVVLTAGEYHDGFRAPEGLFNEIYVMGHFQELTNDDLLVWIEQNRVMAERMLQKTSRANEESVVSQENITVKTKPTKRSVSVSEGFYESKGQKASDQIPLSEADKNLYQRYRRFSSLSNADRKQFICDLSLRVFKGQSTRGLQKIQDTKPLVLTFLGDAGVVRAQAMRMFFGQLKFRLVAPENEQDRHVLFSVPLYRPEGSLMTSKQFWSVVKTFERALS